MNAWLSHPPFQENSTWRAVDKVTLATQGNGTLRGPVSDSSRFLMDLNIALWRVVPPLLLVFGTFGNLMTVLVMRGMRASPTTACLALYFTALAVSDQCQLVVSVIFYCVQMGYSWPPFLFRYNVLCSLPKCLWNVTEITSSWFLVAMTYQRVTSVVAPHRVGVLCTLRRGKVVVAAIVFVACALNSHFFVTWVYYPEGGYCYFHSRYISLIDYFEWQEMVCYVVIPFLFLVIGNSVLVWHVIKAVRVSRAMTKSVEQQGTSRKDQVYSMSVTLIITSTAYLLLTLPVCLSDVYLQMVTFDTSGDYYRAVKDLVWSLTLFAWFGVVSCNFYLYMLSGRKFREEAKRYLCRRHTDHAK